MPTPAALSASYVEHVERLERRLTTDEALRRAVGGEFVAVGKLEYHLLRSRGLRDDHMVVDVGCGSGRLAYQLAPFRGIRYLGCDVVPRLLTYAEELCARPDWRFVPTTGAAIPCPAQQADFVCFFSVFTHLPQEDIYRYFREAHRVLKPGGLLVFSFLEFRVPSHWATFIASVDGGREDEHLNQFIERDAIQAWAAPAGFEVRSIHGGDTTYIPLPEEIHFESGATASGAGSLGQSVAVLQKRDAAATAPAPSPALAVDVPTAPPLAATGKSAAPDTMREGALHNVSARAHVPAGESVTVGFMIKGSASRRVLLRAVGPGLRVFGVPGPLERPVLEVFTGDRRCAACDSGWSNNEAVAEAARAVGAFPLARDSSDAALLLTLPPGSHTARVRGGSATDTGEVLVEAYLVS